MRQRRRQRQRHDRSSGQRHEAATTAGSDATAASGSDTTAAGGGAAAGSLADVCPETVVFQTDWNPEAEHGQLYNMVGEGYEVDTSTFRVSGPLVSGGEDTGVKIEIRSGGPAIGFQTVTSQLYADPDILLGYVSTDEAIQNSGEFPTKAVVAPFNINPQIIMWDPATYPDVKAIADLKEPGVKVRYFGGAAYMDFLIQTASSTRRRRTAPTTARRPTSWPPAARTPSRASPPPSRTSTRRC